MSAKKNSKEVAHVVENNIPDAPQDEVITITKDEEGTEKKEPVLKDGVYTEYGVELVNGVKIPVSVIVNEKDLPATFGSLVSEGNGAALIIAQLTAGTRRMIDLAGATMADIGETFPAVIMRGREAVDAEKSK